MASPFAYPQSPIASAKRPRQKPFRSKKAPKVAYQAKKNLHSQNTTSSNMQKSSQSTTENDYQVEQKLFSPNLNFTQSVKTKIDQNKKHVHDLQIDDELHHPTLKLNSKIDITQQSNSNDESSKSDKKSCSDSGYSSSVESLDQDENIVCPLKNNDSYQHGYLYNNESSSDSNEEVKNNKNSKTEQKDNEDMHVDEFDPYLFIKYLPSYDEVKIDGKLCLPSISPDDKNKLCVVLDLDETLVHCSIETIQNPDIIFPVNFGGFTYHVNVKKRPNLDFFLDTVSKLFEVVVFTASQEIYADKLLDLIDPQRNRIRHRLFREACLFVDGNYLKDLNVLGRDLQRCVVVDNSPYAYGYQLDNGIPIESWYDNENDNELLKILEFLNQLASQPDVRPIIRETFKSHERVNQANQL